MGGPQACPGAGAVKWGEKVGHMLCLSFCCGKDPGVTAHLGNSRDYVRFVSGPFLVTQSGGVYCNKPFNVHGVVTPHHLCCL